MNDGEYPTEDEAAFSVDGGRGGTSSRLSTITLERAGFTLIELLVVIAIIGILMAITFPLIRKAREGARQVVCRNNLRQLMVGFFNFAHDHEDQLPGSFFDSNQVDSELRDWLRGNPHQWTSAPTGGTLYRYLNATPGVYRCPSLEPFPCSPSAFTGPRVGSNGQYDYVSILDFTGARIGNVQAISRLIYPDGHAENLPTPVIVEGDPAVLNGLNFVSYHASNFSIAHTHDGVGFYASIDGSVHAINDTPGGCTSWQAQSPSGKWLSLYPFPCYFGAWNQK